MTSKPTLRFLSALLAVCMLFGMWSPGFAVHAEGTTTLPLSYDFEADTVGAAPAGSFTLEAAASDGTILVAADPADSENQVMLLNDTATTGSALKATLTFPDQTGKVVVSYKVKFGQVQQYVINLLGDDTQGPRFVAWAADHANAQTLQYTNSGTWSTSGPAYECNTWYTVKFVADVEADTYDLYINDEQVATGAGFAKSLTKINGIQFTTVGKMTGELYIDDITVAVPESSGNEGGEGEDGGDTGDGGDTDTTPARYTFEDDTVGAAPANITPVVTMENTVTVAADPANAENMVMKLADPDDGSAKAQLGFDAVTEQVEIAFRLRVSANGQYNINLYGDDDTLGPRFMLRGGNFEYMNGSWQVAGTHAVDTWYTVKIAANVTADETTNAAAKTYSVYVNDEAVATNAAFVKTSMTALNMLEITTAGPTVGDLYIDDIVITVPESTGNEGGEGGGDPVVPPVDPEDPEVPEAPEVAFDFEEDTLNKAPKYITVTRTSDTATVKVVADPTDPDNQVMLLDNPADGPAPHALVNFSEQIGEFSVAYRVMFGSDAQYGVLLQSGTDTDKQGAYFVSRDSNNATYASKVQNIDGSNWNTLFDEVTLNAWYSVQIDANVNAKTYNISVTDANGVTKTATGTFRHASNITSLNYMSFETQGKYAGKLYVDDIAVPDPIKVEIPEIDIPEVESPEIEKYIPAYMDEQLLADGSASTYLCFPSILKLSDEKVLIVYKAGVSHANDESSMDLIVYNPTTKEVVSKTTIDGTIGENAQNPEIMQMPNGDLVIYLDIQRTSSSGQQRYGVKEVRSTDGGATWKVLAADGTYKAVDEVEKHGYKVLKDDQGIVYGYTFDDVTVDGTVYMLAMSFPEFAADPGRSVHVIKSSDNGETWTHVKNLNVEFNLSFNESTLEAYGDGFIVNCRPDSNGTPRTYYTDGEFNVVKGYDYAGYTDLIKTTNRPKLFIENGKYYLLGRNILSGATTLCLYEIDPATMAPLNYIELKNLPGHTTGNSFYAEYYLQEENGVTYFNVITYDDTRHKGHPDIVRYEYAWEELLTQTPVVPEWTDGAVSVENVTMNSADVVFKAPSDDEFVTDYTITLNGETAGTVDFEEIVEVTGTLTGAKTNHSGQGAYYIAMPKTIPEGMKLPVVIAVHGSGRGAMDYRDTAFYAEQKNIALANGYIFAAISNGPDTWGLDDGLYNINLFYDFLIENYPIQEKAALWATSAGGTLANRMVKEYPEKVSFVLGTFPVYDLISGFNNVNSCKTAWGTSDLETFQTKIEGKNPADFPDALKNHDYYIAHGSADAAVPIAENSQKMVTDVGGNVHLEVIEGGVHGTSNYAFYGDIIDQAFAEHPAVYTYALTGLTADTDYTVSVTASDADGYAVVSNTASFKTLAEGETPEDPEDPEESTNVTYTFEEATEEEALDAFELVSVTANSPITVAEDPANAENHVMKILKSAVDSAANKANVYFEKQTETVTVSAKVRFGAGSRFVINLYGDETLGTRILLEMDGRVRYVNGGGSSAVWVTDDAKYALDTWYTFKIVANVETDTYDFYLDDEQIAAGAAFQNALDKVNMLEFATFGANTAEVYVDDVNVPEPPAVLYYVPEYFVQQMLFSPADDTVDTEHKYCAFPTILKLSDEKVIIVYKRGYSHMDDESNMEAIVYNPKTETVLSRTVLDATEGENAQNPELMQMPNGDLMIYLDVQRTTSSGRQRYGIKQFRSTDGGETWEVLKNEDGSYKDLIDDTGIEYGYTFDDVIVGNDVYMLAMTFAEFNNDQAAPGRSTHIIKSSDNGATWTHIKNLNNEFNFAFNESTLEPCGDGFMIVARGDSGAKPRTYLVDKDFKMLKEQDYADFSDQLISIGRPKLFIEDGKYYLLCRNVTEGTTLALYELDPVTLEPLSYIRLNQKSGDAGASFYAESYFQEKHDQKFLNVVTYDDSRQSGKPDIVRYEYVWEEIVTQKAVEVVACTFDQEVAQPEYLVTENCTEAAVYYKSCSCGAASKVDTFTTGEVLGHDWSNNDGLCARCGKFAIERTNMRFGSDLSLLFAVRQSNVGDLTGLYAKVTKTVDGADSEVVTIPSADWTTATIGSVKYYVVEFDGFAAKEMTDEVTVEIMDADGNVLNVDFATSIRAYAMDILGKTDNAEYKTAIVDMLSYGTAAQEYFDDYNIDEPANKLLSAEQRLLASAEGTYEDKRVKDDTYFDASNLRFVSKINLIFRLKISNDTYAVFTWTDHNGNSKSVRVENTDYATSEGMYAVELDELVVADARQLVTCTIYNASDDSVVTTVVDSVESNAARRTENTEKLYVAFMKFADSAHVYLHSK